jgi:4-hydroxybenzoyl-CoA thioesterase
LIGNYSKISTDECVIPKVSFSTRITVAFGDTDPAGIVYYPNLFHYCHIAMERFFKEECASPYAELIIQRRIGFPTVKIEAQFEKAVAYGEELEIVVEVESVGQRSLTINYKLNRSDLVECAQAKMVHVAMDLDSGTSIEIPTDLRERLKILNRFE